jgi:hypothetical protein
MKIELPSVDDVLNRKNWTGHSLKELVEFGRVTPNKGAEDWIVAEQKKQLDAGFELPFDKIGEYVKIWEQLEYEVLDALVAIQEASE